MSKHFTIMDASQSLVWSSVVKYCTYGTEWITVLFKDTIRIVWSSVKAVADMHKRLEQALRADCSFELFILLIKPVIIPQSNHRAFQPQQMKTHTLTRITMLGLILCKTENHIPITLTKNNTPF